MRIAVTGGAGFIGSHVAEAYLRAGHEVVVVDNLSTGCRANVPQGAELQVMDIADPALVEFLIEQRIEIVNHHAAQVSVHLSIQDPLRDAQYNVLGSLNVYEAARRAGVRRIIVASSGGTVYGEQQDLPVTEAHPLQPLSPYGVAKVAAEHYLRCYSRLYGIEAVVLRYTNVYGPRQNPYGEAGVVAIFTERLLRGQTPIIYGDGEQTRDYVYVTDVAEANVLALQPSACGVYNCCSGVETSVNALLEMLQQLVGTRLSPQYAPLRIGELRRSACSYARIACSLGWYPRTPLPEGLARTVAAFRKCGRE
ncbi:MAG: NAD-dependent epimerase/dehydratase family protein [Candidatus Kapabacteria bacterium]|nr:NAD-dependent epimerase/dehydratase family protein [Candidatus Kapabacteria bacterium]MCS7170475.1 NAD-dependent epimerase/dehydratase family protein [Candidatus Kapabacteria bacterium]MDW7996527.1 NAD-dependent epimerase/dehydratase family protein [Bacteroidota bacterium]MDW8225788.1 NAD-dependent epimerase/dehydratase family protein [Bacteroidota bacterium]